MRTLREGFHLQILSLLVIMFFFGGPHAASANDLCPFDASGEYTYEAGRTPPYLFYGDGQITYDGSIPWYLDDTLACYNVYTTPVYFQYFPKCDLDGDGAVEISEVYDIYYRIHPVGQNDYVAQSACSEAFATQSFYFCPPSRFNRTVNGINAIVANYPATEAIADLAAGGLGHANATVEYNQLRCTTASVFPPGIFDSLDACYLGTSTCDGAPCNAVNVDFSQAVDTHHTSADYSAIAQNYGGICETVASGYTTGDAPGFHYYQHPDDANWFFWDVRATAQCIGANCDCRHDYQLWTHRDYPTDVWFGAEVNLSNTGCTDVRFPGATACIDTDDDGVCDTDDQCPGEDDTLDTDGDGVPDCLDPCPNDNPDDPDGDGICGEPAVQTIEDFENTVDAWPWAPWVTTSSNQFSSVMPAAAHDGAQGLDRAAGWTYRTDVSFGTVENEVLSAWCMPGVDYNNRCGIGFGADGSGSYLLSIHSYSDTLSFVRAEDQSTILTVLEAKTLTIDYGEWYRLELHVRPGGVLDGQLFASDGVTPLASIQHTFGTLSATGVSFYGDGEARVDTIEMYMGDGSCFDMDGDGACDGDDLCQGDDATGDSDGDGICDEIDLCIGIDLLGDADGDGYCDEHSCDPNTPPFYDQAGSEVNWTAGGTCIEFNGISGPMACPQSQWQTHVDDIQFILDTYDWTNAIYDHQTGAGQTFGKIPYELLCSGFTLAGLDDIFNDLNACYHGNNGWNSNHSMNILTFDWAVNVQALLSLYDQRAAMFGGICELSTLFGIPTGFHAADQGGWIYWDVNSMEDCDFYGCRCDATVTGWSDGAGNFYEDTVVNNSGVIQGTGCTDSRFSF